MSYFRPPDKTTWIEGRIRKPKERKTMDAGRLLILDMIDEATDPSRTTAAEAMVFLQELHTDITGRIDALKDENPELADA
jgi:hypothetical protein